MSFLTILDQMKRAVQPTVRMPADVSRKPIQHNKPGTRAKARNLRRSMRKSLRHSAPANLHTTHAQSPVDGEPKRA